jgi:hypothetical protein
VAASGFFAGQTHRKASIFDALGAIRKKDARFSAGIATVCMERVT